MKFFSLLLVATVAQAKTATSVNSVHVHKQPDISEHADEAGKVAKQLGHDASKALADASSKITSQVTPHSQHSPIGEGAYQSAAAVMERTTDKRTDCEDGKWKDCYKSDGDFLDHHDPKPKTALDHLEHHDFLKSGAFEQHLALLENICDHGSWTKEASAAHVCAQALDA